MRYLIRCPPRLFYDDCDWANTNCWTQAIDDFDTKLPRKKTEGEKMGETKEDSISPINPRFSNIVTGHWHAIQPSPFHPFSPSDFSLSSGNYQPQLIGIFALKVSQSVFLLYQFSLCSVLQCVFLIFFLSKVFTGIVKRKIWCEGNLQIRKIRTCFDN